MPRVRHLPLFEPEPKHVKRIALLWCALLVVAARPAGAQTYLLQTHDLFLIYNQFTQSFIAPHTARCFENALSFYRRVYGYSPSQPVTVLLDDSGDTNNAFAWAAPRNSILIKIAPTNLAYETSPSNERINHTLNHEMAHVVALDQASGLDKAFRGMFFGKVRDTDLHPETILYGHLSSPRRSAPRWYHEGIAVFLETWLAGGVGRAQGAYDEMVFRAMVRDSSRFYDPLGLEAEGTHVDFQGGVNSYLYGTRFMSYLGYRYSPEAVVRWTSRTPGSKGYYTSQFRNVFGVSLDEAWKDWIRWEHGFQAANLDSLRRYPITPFHDLTRRALGSVSRAYLNPDHRTLYAAVNYPGVLGHLAAISLEDGSEKALEEVKGPALYYVTSLAYDPAAGALYYTTDNDDWRDLCKFDLATGKATRLQKDVRIGDLVLDPTDRALWGLRHFNGIVTLVRMPPPYTRWNQIYSWPYGKVMYDIDLSPDGRQIAYAMAEISGRQTLQVAAIDSFRAGNPAARVLYDFGSSVPASFTFSADGRYLIGSSYRTGVSNIWRWNFAADSMEVLSNTETGLFHPIPLGGDSLLAFRYSGEGFVPGILEGKPLQDVSSIRFLGNEIAETHPVVRDWNVGSPARIPLDSLITYEGPYHSFRHVGLGWLVPVVEGYKNTTAMGLVASLQDPAYVNSLDLSLSYSPGGDLLKDGERVHATAEFSRGPWTLNAAANGADFYDLFGPTKTSRKGESLGLRYKKLLMQDDPKSLDLTVSSTGYIDLERLPYAQNITVSFDKLWTTLAHLSYKNLRASMGAVDYEKGYQWGVLGVNNFANHKSFPLVAGNFDVGVPLLLDHASLWLRTAAGYSPGDRLEPFANFYFGGFGNNWVDHGDVKRYRDWDSFPGIEINEAGGTNFAKATLDWNLPPLRFRRAGVPWFYVNWARTSIFTSVLGTNLDNPAEAPRQVLGNLGAQIDFRFTLLSHLNMTASVGYAGASAQNRTPSDTFMFSLKIL
jgi:WD40 repeat protein